MNAAHNSTQRQLFLKDYAEVIPIVIGLRNDGYSLPEIAKDLNSRGFMTRENKPFSHVQVLRILQRTHDANSQTMGQDSTQNKLIESQVQSDVELLKSEICALKTHVEKMQQEMSEIKSQLSELTKENQQLKTDFVKLTSAQSCSVQGVQSVQDSPIESVRPRANEPNEAARTLGSGSKKAVVQQQAIQLRAENSELNKTDIAKVLARQYNIPFRAVSRWLVKLW